MQAVVRSRKSVLAGAVQAALAAGLLLHGGSAIAQYDEGGYDSSGTSSVQGAPAGEGSMGATQVTPADAGQGVIPPFLIDIRSRAIRRSWRTVAWG